MLSLQLYGQRHSFLILTGKQIEALSKEYDYGYYSTPRRITTESISATLGISRSTYEEHLRKAENKVIESPDAVP